MNLAANLNKQTHNKCGERLSPKNFMMKYIKQNIKRKVDMALSGIKRTRLQSY